MNRLNNVSALLVPCITALLLFAVSCQVATVPGSSLTGSSLRADSGSPASSTGLSGSAASGQSSISDDPAGSASMSSTVLSAGNSSHQSSLGLSSASPGSKASSSASASAAPTAGPTAEPFNTDNRNFDFNGPISKEVLNNYLSKAVTHNGFASFAGYGNVPAGGNPDFAEDFRMIKNIGAMFIGRAAHVWGYADEEPHYTEAARIASLVHSYNTKIILQAAVFEAIYKDNVNAIPVPAWVFAEFGLPAAKRNFSYSSMLFTGGFGVDQWGQNGSVPDLTRQETQMWYFYRCARYIDAGYEAVHLGQLSLVSRSDSGKLATAGVLDRIRKYAAKNARRKWVILDAHMYAAGDATYIKDGKTHLLLDFHAFPLRPNDAFAGSTTAADGFQPAKLQKNFRDSIYGRSAGGINPSGWQTDYNPFLCEFDNSGYSVADKDKNTGGMWPWGYDEITWFSKQPEPRRSEVLIEFHAWINTNYEYGNIQMPTRVPLAYPFVVYYTSEEFGTSAFNNIHFFKANTQSPASLVSFNLEATIKKLWRKPR
ncbi:MAG: hypothetical protein ACYCYM_03250 [Saccharofermentanales bacterium]